MSSRKRKAKGSRPVASGRPVGFLSYAHFDDQHNNGWITDFRRQLSGEVQAQTGRKFSIFYDREDIKWGDAWDERISGAIETATFFFPIVTPSFFESENCKHEIRKFLAHEEARKRKDLLFPVYYIKCKDIDGKCRTGLGRIVKAIKGHQYRDLTQLRFAPIHDLQVRKVVAEMAEDVATAIESI